MISGDLRRDSGVPLLVGFVVGSLTISLVIFLLMRSFRGQFTGGHAVNVYNTSGTRPFAMPVPIQPSLLGNAMQLADGTSLATKTDTVTLSTLRASRVFTAPHTGPMWRVRLQMGGPAGTFGSFAIDGNPDVSGGQSLMLTAGQHSEVRLGARQSISGIAVGGDTFVSYVAAAEVV